MRWSWQHRVLDKAVLRREALLVEALRVEVAVRAVDVAVVDVAAAPRLRRPVRWPGLRMVIPTSAVFGVCPSARGIRV